MAHGEQDNEDKQDNHSTASRQHRLKPDQTHGNASPWDVA
jgi:hypothetical protein